MLLTGIVWLYMYVRRVHFFHKEKVDVSQLKTPLAGARLMGGEVSYAAFNLQNLFELPVIFYALCLYLFVIGSVDSLYLGLAWWFVGFRTLHSIVHCTFNHVMLRFSVYMLASAALWVMVIRASIDAF